MDYFDLRNELTPKGNEKSSKSENKNKNKKENINTTSTQEGETPGIEGTTAVEYTEAEKDLLGLSEPSNGNNATRREIGGFEDTTPESHTPNIRDDTTAKISKPSNNEPETITSGDPAPTAQTNARVETPKTFSPTPEFVMGPADSENDSLNTFLKLIFNNEENEIEKFFSDLSNSTPEGYEKVLNNKIENIKDENSKEKAKKFFNENEDEIKNKIKNKIKDKTSLELAKKSAIEYGGVNIKVTDKEFKEASSFNDNYLKEKITLFNKRALELNKVVGTAEKFVENEQKKAIVLSKSLIRIKKGESIDTEYKALCGQGLIKKSKFFSFFGGNYYKKWKINKALNKANKNLAIMCGGVIRIEGDSVKEELQKVNGEDLKKLNIWNKNSVNLEGKKYVIGLSGHWYDRRKNRKVIVTGIQNRVEEQAKKLNKTGNKIISSLSNLKELQTNIGDNGDINKSIKSVLPKRERAQNQ